jgi:16S rRNA (adenine1518-N6/adenine1519-N6)-dimethyltransferase
MTTPPSSPRQTLSYLRSLLAARGIHPKDKLGQNFLIDLNVVDLLVRAAELSRDDLVIEVGSGTGSLTARLAEQAGAVLSIEIDRDFFELAREATAGRPNVHLLYGDILRSKNELSPQVFSALDEITRRSDCEFGSAKPGLLKLVANLPYAVAVPVISNFLLTDLCFERMVVTVQWEIAERLLARPSTKPYGALAVLVQSLAEVTLVRRLPPSVFWPRPQVASAIVLIRPDPVKRARVGDVSRFRHFLRDLYSHRRKNLRGALAGLPSGRRDKAEVDRKLAELALPGTVRAEDLEIQDHLRLCGAFGGNQENGSGLE